MSKTKSKPRLNVQEFQTWLQGIMEFQSEDWSPNPEQWNAIYDKIMNLKTDDTAITTNISAASLRKIQDLLQEQIKNFRHSSEAAGGRYINPPRNNVMNPPVMEPQQPMSGGLFDEAQSQDAGTVGGGGVMPGQELISAEEFPQLTPEEIAERIKQAKDGVPLSDGSKTIKTPSVDSTKGYKSGFV